MSSYTHRSHRSKPFPFTALPNELALEIIRHAMIPDVVDATTSNRDVYQRARSLCLVSSAMRAATMPHLLYTVVLPDTRHVLAFREALRLQSHHLKYRSRLALDYRALVKRMWFDACAPGSPAFVGAPEYDFSRLYDLVAYVPSLGFTAQSESLLHEGVQANWRCTRLTLAGICGPRWKPLLWSTHGTAFLSKLTHLVLWQGEPVGRDAPTLIPAWIRSVPFASMPNLARLAIPIHRAHAPVSGIHEPTDMLVYTRSRSRQEPTVFVDYAMCHEPLAYGDVVPLPPMSVRHTVEYHTRVHWEENFLREQNETVWAQADSIRSRRHR
ncbi:hypothetical protein PLICRDRAFT_34648 [Plicaturopsis crispa FD-325 SS-3]|nr:hypothetical protein PLICRDRAFT_34648 [Plicaturopsis crispa FD-325 SS-3]